MLGFLFRGMPVGLARTGFLSMLLQGDGPITIAGKAPEGFLPEFLRSSAKNSAYFALKEHFGGRRSLIP